MIELEPTPAGVYVRLGPFETEEQAKDVEQALRELAAAGWVAASRPAIPSNLEAAIGQGLRHLAAAGGHFSIRVDANRDGGLPKVEYSAGGTFRSKTA